MAEILHNGSDNKRDLFNGKIVTRQKVNKCPQCGQMPVYCFPYGGVTDIEIYCDTPGCGFGAHSNRVSEAVAGWNAWTDIINRQIKKEDKINDRPCN